MQSVLIVDDSATARLALRQAIEQDPELYVIGEADRGSEALTLARRYRPSVITMDVMLNRENGIDVAASIMSEAACPIVIVTACDTSDPTLAYQALQVGALEVVSKLPGPFTPEYPERVTALTRLLRNVATIPVVTRRKRESVSSVPAVAPTLAPQRRTKVAPRLVVVGASTGGPPQLREFLARLLRNPAVPIAIAQHISQGFGRGFTEWLKETTGKNTIYVDKTMPLIPGNVYIAPDDADLTVDGRLFGVPKPASSIFGTPSVDVLFTSAAVNLGPAVVALLMTGMGRDGAIGTGELARVGASTLVQEPKTCTVSSMPEAALRAAPDSTRLLPSDFAKVVDGLILGERPSA